MILTSDVSQIKDTAEMIEFYKGQFESVEVVTCRKCKEDLALELMGGNPQGMHMNEIGIIVLPISPKLQASRVRLDEAPNGERMRGYQCACGNDTRISSIEEEYLPQAFSSNSPSALDPYTKHKLIETIRLRSDYKAKFSKNGNAKYFESFKVERVK